MQRGPGGGGSIEINVRSWKQVDFSTVIVIASVIVLIARGLCVHNAEDYILFLFQTNFFLNSKIKLTKFHDWLLLNKEFTEIILFLGSWLPNIQIVG